MRDKYDVIIIGSGAAGGMSAYVAAHAGAKVLMLEAGRFYDPARETPMFQWNYQAPLRGMETPEKPFGFYVASVAGGWQVPGEPFTQAPGTQFHYFRSRMLGGRTNCWGRFSPRMGPLDFKPKSRDGLGFDWPISYEDVAPYYDKVESLIGVCGENENLENHPSSPSGSLLPAPRMKGYELLLKKHCREMGIPVVPPRLAILTRPHRGRPQCLYATSCDRGCAIGANFQSPNVLIFPSLKTGNLEVRTNVMVREIGLDKNGKASDVVFIDKISGMENKVSGRSIVLAASSCESARILLNSKSSSFPDGLANSSGQVGRSLMDSVCVEMIGQIPALENTPAYNEDGLTRGHACIPWWGYELQRKGILDFPRGYRIQLNGGRFIPDMGLMGAMTRATGALYGIELKKAVKKLYPSFIQFQAFGEMIPNTHSYCDLDPETKDRWGIPVLRFHWKWSNYEARQWDHTRKTIREIISSMGGKELKFFDDSNLSLHQTDGGGCNHEVGTTRMGNDSVTSVLDQFGRAWDVPNLYILDGGAFASCSEKNPTLTILALAWRGTEHLLAQLNSRQF